jgi:hypothetical protein
MAQQRRRCTCGAPPPSVDLTRAYDLLNLDKGDYDPEMHATIRRQLVGNLQSTGWSLVQLNVRELATDPASDTNRRLRSTLQAHELWKDQLMELFEPDVVAAASKRIASPNIVYRAAESGAPGTVEPKKSWEVLRCNCSKSSEGGPLRQEEGGSIVEDRMKEWVSVLHSVAVTVQRILQFPDGILLHEESCHSNDAASTMPCSADLLRAFFYDTVTPSSDDSPHCMGSSPHTDWGSFTVVWQDTVGGLQTFCHGCEQWADVPAEFPGDNGVVRFVVHVGDVTSLALGHALQTSSNERREAATDGNFETSSVVWPSPKHRVLSPTTQKRASLVYFAYPPHDISIRDITTNLSSWCQQQQIDSQSLGPNRVPYDEYYLLHNQSKASSVTPEQQFEAIVDRPLKDILADKWEQVQRG